MYLAHLCVYRRDFLERIGLCDSAFDGGQDWELALRATAQTERIRHIPQILYHWRLGGNSAGSAFNRLCHERGRIAIGQAMQRFRHHAVIANGPSPCTFHVRYQWERAPLVSILIPTRDNPQLLRNCLRSLRCRTDYAPYEILVIDNGSRRPETLRYLRDCRADKVLRYDMPFNHSLLNNLAAREANGDLLLLLNDDTEVINPGWLQAMVEQTLRPEVGAVGAWLFHPDGRTQHNGIVLGIGPVASPLHSGITRDGLDRGTCRLIRNVSAVTGACLMVRKKLYQEIGGLDARHLPTSFNDVDLCLRLRQAGYRIIQTPLARLWHQESATRRIGAETVAIRTMWERWGDLLARDPYWNPNLAHGVALPPGLSFHWGSEVPAVRLDKLYKAA
jgi:GT2 family glycosyltransferase